ncbi:MAG: tetratricopeptide repeat protein [Gammaproteobacteria bacterium]|nr:tetratricopeptide repeat protein [Gammaproteobacteria bacterium]
MRKIAHLSVLHLFVAIVFFSALVIIEKYYLSRDLESTVISIVPDEDSMLEVMTESSMIRVSENLSLFLEKFTAEKVMLSEMHNLSEFKLLTDSDTPVMWLKLAEIFYALHDYAQVVTILEKLDEKQRIRLDALFMYAYSLSKAVSKDRAIDQYRLLLIQKSNAQAATFNLALLLKKKKRYDEAIAVFTKAVEISSGKKKAKAYAGLATSYYNQRDFKQATEFFRKSLDYRPGVASIWIQLAKSMAASDEKYPAVLNSFDKGIALNPDDFKAYLLKAEYQIQNLAYTEAIATLDNALIISDDPRMHELLAWSHIELGSRAKARKSLNRTQKHSLSAKFRKRVEFLMLYLDKEYQKLAAQLQKPAKSSKDLLYLQGLTYRKMGYFKSAFKTFGQLDNIRKYQWRVKTQTVRMLRSRKQYVDALEQFETLLAHNQNAAFLWFEASLTHEALTQFKPGLEKINQAIALRPDKKAYHLARARLLRLAGRQKEAIAGLEALLRTYPKYLRAMHLTAGILSEGKDTVKLIEIYNRILALDPDDYEIQYQLAFAYTSSGINDEARRVLLKLLSEQSHNIKARFLLAKNYENAGLFNQSIDEINRVLKLASGHAEAIGLKNKLMEKIREE